MNSMVAPHPTAEQMTIIEPVETAWNPGRRMIHAPKRPVSTAVQRRRSAFSPRNATAPITTKMAAREFRASACASGTTVMA